MEYKRVSIENNWPCCTLQQWKMHTPQEFPRVFLQVDGFGKREGGVDDLQIENLHGFALIHFGYNECFVPCHHSHHRLTRGFIDHNGRNNNNCKFVPSIIANNISRYSHLIPWEFLAFWSDWQYQSLIRSLTRSFIRQQIARNSGFV